MNQRIELVLTAIGRMEEAGRVNEKRLMVETSDPWEVFRRELGPRDFVGLLVEELAAVYGVPFGEVEVYAAQEAGSPATSPRGIGEVVADSIGSDEEARELLEAAREGVRQGESTIDFLHGAARELGLPGRFAVADQARLEGRQWLLDRPGSCGRYGWGLVSRDDSLSFGRNVVILAEEPQERLLAGLTLVEADASDGHVMRECELGAFRERRGEPAVELSA